MKIMFVRHAEPWYAIDSLTEKGHREAELLSRRLCQLDVKAFYSSPLGRARETGRYTLEKLGREAEILPWLAEFRGKSIDPENAEVLYKQVVEQSIYNSKVKDYAKTYSSMKAKEAAAIFDTMTGDLKLVADILLNMSAKSRADILGKMDPEIAAKVTAIMEPHN